MSESQQLNQLHPYNNRNSYSSSSCSDHSVSETSSAFDVTTPLHQDKDIPNFDLDDSSLDDFVFDLLEDIPIQSLEQSSRNNINNRTSEACQSVDQPKYALNYQEYQQNIKVLNDLAVQNTLKRNKRKQSDLELEFQIKLGNPLYMDKAYQYLYRAQINFQRDVNSAYNRGDIHSIVDLCDTYVHPNCQVVFRVAHHVAAHTGREYIAKHYDALINSHPDSVVSMRGCTTSRQKGYLLIKCKITLQGTKTVDKYLNDFFHNSEVTTLATLIDNTKYTTDEIAKLAEVERKLISQGEMLAVYFKIHILIVVNEASRQIIQYLSNARLLSFQAAKDEIGSATGFPSLV